MIKFSLLSLFLLSSCSVYIDPDIKTGMTKKETRNKYIHTIEEYDPFLLRGGSKFYIQNNKEILWSENKKNILVFKNVSRPKKCAVLKCDLGDGVLERKFYNLSDAISSIK